MKKHTIPKGKLAVLALFLLPLFLSQCTDPTTLGGDLVSVEESDFFTTDTFSLKIKTVESDDSLATFVYGTATRALNFFSLGNLIDPIFGLSKSEVVAHYGPSPGDFGGKLSDATVDSVVLTLVLDSAQFYGNEDVMQSIEVMRLAQPLKIDTTLYSFQDFETVGMPLGQLSFVPNLNKRLLVVSLDSIVKDSNLVYVRIPLENSFGQELLDLDSIKYTTVEGFSDIFKGVKIRATSNTGAMMSINLKSRLSEIDVYYQRPGEDSLLLRMPSLTGSSATEHLSKDYSGAFVESHIDKLNDDLFFVQSMGGLELEIELPPLDSLGDVIINKAVLELTLENLTSDDTTAFRTLRDYILTDTSGFSIFNGYTSVGRDIVAGKIKQVEKGGDIRYVLQLNISEMMQGIQRGTTNRKVILKPRNKLGIGRTVFQGFSGGLESQPKLYLKYTEI